MVWEQFTQVYIKQFINKAEFIEEIKRGIERVPVEHGTNVVKFFAKRVRDAEEVKGAIFHKWLKNKIKF